MSTFESQVASSGDMLKKVLLATAEPKIVGEGSNNLPETMARLTSAVAQTMIEAISLGSSSVAGSKLADSIRTTTEATHTLYRHNC